MLALSNWNKSEPISREQAEKFKLILSDKIVQELAEKGIVNLGCDFHPQGILASAALEAGIKTNFPYRTYMCVTTESIETYVMRTTTRLWPKDAKTKTSPADVPYITGENITHGKAKK